MGREIKFRAWKPHKSLRMKPGVYQVSDLVWYDKPFQDNTGEVFYKGYKTSDYLEDVKLMQYTGLKDKNGVEIFEGDIIAHEVNNMRGAVVWNPASYCYSIDSLDGSEYIADLCDYDWNPEVIGNIYENKELLK